MKRVSGFMILALLGLITLGCEKTEYEKLPHLPVTELPQCTDSVEFSTEVLATGLEVPWDLDFTPDGRIFFTERNGRIRVIENGKLKPEPWAEIPVYNQGVVGLMGIAVSPDFDKTGYVYVVGTKSRMGKTWAGKQFRRIQRTISRPFSRDAGFVYYNRVYRFRDKQGRGTERRVIIDNLPSETWHGTSSLNFGPDGMLYVSTGYSGEPTAAMDLHSFAGKILRYTPDGDIPPDNPIKGSPVYAYGFRQSQGWAWHPDTGELFATEHGPTGYDELNQILAKGNYGWPVVTGPGPSDAYKNPLITWQNSIAPSGLAFYWNNGHKWHGNMFIGSLWKRHLRRVKIERDKSGHGWKPVCEQVLLKNTFGRIRAVRQGPDGYLYFTTSNRDHNGYPVPDDDRLVRIKPLN